MLRYTYIALLVVRLRSIQYCYSVTTREYIYMTLILIRFV
jgi:hypothetical protein